MAGEVLIGRRLVLGALQAAADAAVAGSGGVVLLAGDPGMGKTALASETVAYAKARGALAVWGSCWEGDGAPGYWPWIQALRALEAGQHGNERVLAELTGARQPGGGGLGDDSAARFRTYDTVATYLGDRAARQPVVVVFDDLHWADLSSLRLLGFVVRQLHAAAVLVVGTYRDVDVAVEDHPGRALLAELAGQSELFKLTGLTLEEVGELLQTICGERPPAALVGAVHQRTAGNPFFVRQVARLLSAQGTPLAGSTVTGVPPAVGDVLARRLARLPSTVADVLATASVIGRRFSIEAAAAIAGASVESVVALLDIAVRAGVVERDAPGDARFSHDLFREVLYAGLATLRRSELHLAVAQLLERPDGPATGAAEIADHRAKALPLGGRDRAAAAFVEAGREATVRTAFDEAAAHLGHAVELAGGTASADLETLCGYGDALRRAGAGEEARAVFVEAAARARSAGNPADLARAAFGAHRVTTLTGSSRSAVIALLSEGLGALGDVGDDAARMRSLLPASLARELADGPDRDLPRAIALASAAVEDARAHNDPGALAYALFALIDVRWEPGTAAERLALADEQARAAAATGEVELLLEAHLAKLVALLELGDPAFVAQLDTFTRLAEDVAIPRYVYLARSRHATHASLTGPFALADELIEAAAAYGERIDEPDTWGVQASQLVGLAFLRHDWTRLSALAAAHGLPLSPPEFAPHERAWLLIEAGDRAAAAAVLATVPPRPAVYRWRQAVLLAADAELAVAVGDRARCAALYGQLAPMADQFAVVAAAVFTTGPVALQLGLLAAVLERWADAARHLEDAVARCDRLGARLIADRARCELDRVRGAEATGDVGTGNELRRAGQVWTLAFAGREVRLPDAKGLRDLAVLLAAPGRDVAAADLVAGVADGARQAGAGLGADPVLDERARTAYRGRLAELDDRLAEADADGDGERSARLAAERDALLAELARATGLGGRRRRLGDPTERARTTVTARIRDTIARIEQAHPELGRHLRASVLTGTRCTYRPAETVRWVVSQS